MRILGKKSKMKKEYLMVTLVASILIGIILPLAVTSSPIDWKRFFYIMAMGFTLVWVVSSIILFAYVFLIEGKRNRDRLERRKGKDPFPLHSTKEWEDLWKTSVKRNKGQEISNTNWN